MSHNVSTICRAVTNQCFWGLNDFLSKTGRKPFASHSAHAFDTVLSCICCITTRMCRTGLRSHLTVDIVCPDAGYIF